MAVGGFMGTQGFQSRFQSWLDGVTLNFDVHVNVRCWCPCPSMFMSMSMSISVSMLVSVYVFVSTFIFYTDLFFESGLNPVSFR